MTTSKRTSLYDFHAQQGGRFVTFAGWEMPVQYTGILEEHRAVRERLGLFDVSHMGEISVEGPEAGAFLDYLVTNNVAPKKDGEAIYTPMCYEHGGVVDDLIIYRFLKNSYLLCVNAANTDQDFEWIAEHAREFDCKVENVSADYAQLALQGPLSLEPLARLTTANLKEVRPFSFVETIIAGVPAFISRTGYTGERGVEIYCPADIAETVVKAIMEESQPYGLALCGLGARDSLRLEAGYALYGHEISESISPLQGGLGWTVKLDKPGDFIGKTALQNEKEGGVKRRIVHFRLEGRRIARQGEPVYCGDKEVGQVVSGTLSPIIERPIGAALINLDGTDLDNLHVNLRGNIVSLERKKPPLHVD